MRVSVYQLKSRFQRLLQPVLHALARSGISPNQLTLGTLAFMLLYGAALALWPQERWLWAGLPVVLFLRMALNALDGMLALQTGQTTRAGAMLNEISDPLADAALYLPLALVAGVSGAWVVVTVVLALMTEVTGLAALAVGSVRRFDGPMGKSDRAVAFGVLGVLVALEVGTFWLHAVLAFVLVMLVLTLHNRWQSTLSQNS
jgi:CDP-diacylglycerol--glycerol-3-phosphate 3-phosphatidyltransferase